MALAAAEPETVLLKCELLIQSRQSFIHFGVAGVFANVYDLPFLKFQ